MNESNSSKIKVLIADDHAVVRHGLKQIISKTSDIVVVDEAEDGNEALEKVSKIKVDVVLLDIEMPGKSGWDVLLQLKSEFPKLPVLILSTHSEALLGIRSLKAGASGYLSKMSAPDQLIEALRKIAKGGKYASPTLAELLVSDLGRETPENPHETLSDREFQIFCMIASGTKLKTIAKELSVAPTTISTYRSRILEKMNMDSDAKLVRYAIKNGLVD